jgi:hypothetical protein
MTSRSEKHSLSDVADEIARIRCAIALSDDENFRNVAGRLLSVMETMFEDILDQSGSFSGLASPFPVKPS